MSPCVTLGNQRKPNSGSLEKNPLAGRTFPHPDWGNSHILDSLLFKPVPPEPVSVPLSVVTSVERESDSVVKKEERNLCFTHDEDEEKDDDVSVYCVQAQGSLVCWVAACGRDTATLCSTYTLYVYYIYDTGTL